MAKIELKSEGKDLAKVMHYYGLYEGSSLYKIVCPFHEDVNASLKINIDEGSFYCFGCGATGDAMKFVSMINKSMDDLKSGIEFYKILKSDKSKAIILPSRSKKITHNKQANLEARHYYFGLRTVDWAEEDCPERDYLLARGFTIDSLNKTKAKLTYNDQYPIVFPMNDMGKFRGYVCRTMNKQIEKKRKYLYNEGFSRSDTLVGNYNNEVVMVVEGYMDYLKARQLGVTYVCAILGWKTTAMQLMKLKEAGVKYIISALDRDKCGNDGSAYLAQHFKVIRFQYPLTVKDMGDMTAPMFEKANLETIRKFKEATNGLNRRHKKSGKEKWIQQG